MSRSENLRKSLVETVRGKHSLNQRRLKQTFESENRFYREMGIIPREDGMNYDNNHAGNILTMVNREIQFEALRIIIYCSFLKAITDEELSFFERHKEVFKRFLPLFPMLQERAEQLQK